MVAREEFTVQSGYEEAVYFDDSDHFFRLSKVDSGLEYDRNGDYEDKVYILWENWQANAISELLSFNPAVGYEMNRWGREQYTNYYFGAVKYHLSNDDGSTFYYWDGAAWSLVTDPSIDAQWNTAEEIDENIGTFPLVYDADENVQIRPRIMIYSGGYGTDSSHDNTVTPSIKEISFGVRYDYDAVMDLLNSIVKWIEDNFVGNFVGVHVAEEGASTFELVSDFTIASIKAVYNKTTDPNKETNIYSSYASVTGIVTVITPFSNNDELEILFTGACPVIVEEDPELVETVIPAIVVKGIDKDTEKNMGSLEGVYISPKISSDFSFVAKDARWSSSVLRIACIATNSGVAVYTSGALAALFENNRVIRSLATGDYFYIMNTKPYEDQDNIPGKYNKKYLGAELLYQDWARDGSVESISEIKNIEEIHVSLEVLGVDQVNPELKTEEEVNNYG